MALGRHLTRQLGPPLQLRRVVAPLAALVVRLCHRLVHPLGIVAPAEVRLRLVAHRAHHGLLPDVAQEDVVIARVLNFCCAPLVPACVAQQREQPEPLVRLRRAKRGQGQAARRAEAVHDKDGRALAQRAVPVPEIERAGRRWDELARGATGRWDERSPIVVQQSRRRRVAALRADSLREDAGPRLHGKVAAGVYRRRSARWADVGRQLVRR